MGNSRDKREGFRQTNCRYIGLSAFRSDALSPKQQEGEQHQESQEEDNEEITTNQRIAGKRRHDPVGHHDNKEDQSDPLEAIQLTQQTHLPLKITQRKFTSTTVPTWNRALTFDASAGLLAADEVRGLQFPTSRKPR